MTSYVVTATATFRGVDFFVEADSVEEAVMKVNAGQYESFEVAASAELTDWEAKEAMLND